jgi:hypothetical protein
MSRFQFFGMRSPQPSTVSRMKIFALITCSLTIAGTNQCAGVVVGAFSAARAGVASLAEGPYTEEMRASIIAAYPGSSRFVGVNSLTPNTLSGLDFVMVGAPTFSSPIFLSSAEQTALLDFIKAGGSALIFVDNDSYAGVPDSDNANETFLDPFGLDSTGRVGFPAAASSIAPGNSVMNGPFGMVETFATNYGGWFDNLGANAIALAHYDANLQTAIAAIAPGALGPGSGRVVFMADADPLVDSADGGLFGAADNEKFFLNSISFAVPEPSTFALLLAAGLVVAGSARRCRTRFLTTAAARADSSR